MKIAIITIIGFFLLFVVSDKKEIRFTVHQTGKIFPSDLSWLFIFTLYMILGIYDQLPFLPYICYCFIFYKIHDLIWTIVGRPGMREERSPGEVLGQLIHFAIIFFPYGITILNVFLNTLFNYYFLFFPFIYALYIYKTRNGWIMKI